jgi:hypothetical protein
MHLHVHTDHQPKDHTHSLTHSLTHSHSLTPLFPRLLAPDLPSNGFSLTGLSCSHSNCAAQGPALVCIVTTSLCQDWVICAPAAFLGSGSHFSGSLSGIEP